MNNNTNGELDLRARALVEKLDRIVTSEAYKAIFCSAYAHGVYYTGETFDKELDAVRALLGIEKPDA